MKKMSYKEKFIQMNKEARATWVLFFIMVAWWCGTGFGLAGWEQKIFGMPAWAFLGTFGTAILASVGTWILANKFFVNFSLDDEDEVEANE